jgi:26S proteasome regulatory subunit N5
MEVETVDEKLPEITPEHIQSIKSLSFTKAMDELVHLERKYRAASDAISLGRILVAIVEIHYESSKFIELNECIESFTLRKHLQSDEAIGAMIRKCCEFSDKISDIGVKMKLLEKLKYVTDGKLYAEIERAKICKELASMRKNIENDIEGAIKTLEDLKIDTLTSLERKDRIEIILQLMEFLIETKEYVKCLIVAKKINQKYLDQTPEYEALKIRYYELMITIDKNDNYLNTSQHYQSILSTQKILSDDSIDERKRLMALAIIYCILAPFDNEKSLMMVRLMNHKCASEVPQYRDLLKEFTTIELINWYTMKAQFKDELKTLGIFDVGTQEGLKHWKDFRTATIEHNIKVFATYYQRAYLSHMSEFLDINIDETEKHLCNLIVNKSIRAKIDRLTGIVTFNQYRYNVTAEKPCNLQQENVLQDWLHQLSTLMKLIDNTSHLINKEEQL